jgi:hypothetical protein
VTHKRCPSCGKTKPSSEFGRNQTLGDGLSFYCLECNRAKSNAHYRKRRDALGLSVRDHSWVPEGFRWCPGCEQALPRENFAPNTRSPSGLSSWCRACKNAASSDAYFYRRYELTKDQVRDMRSSQGDRCAICGDPKPQHLDHDHSTGRVRRLLCQRCNHGLGLFRDEPYLLRVAALYVEGHRQQHALAMVQEAMRDGPEGASRPGSPPVGSDRRPGGRGTTSRTTGRTSRSRRQTQAGEADE